MAKRLGNKKRRIIYRYLCTGRCGKNRYTFNYETQQRAICRKCFNEIPPEGSVSLFDAIESMTNNDSYDINQLVEFNHEL